MDITEPAAASNLEEAGTPGSVRITRQGKIRVWVKKALDFFQDHPDKPFVLYSAPAEVSASTIPRLITVVEIIKREYLKGRDVSTGLHQYNQLLCEEQQKIPIEGEDRMKALHVALDGHSHVKQTTTPHMKITLSIKAREHNHRKRETYQVPAIRRTSKSKARRRKQARKQDENVNGG